MRSTNNLPQHPQSTFFPHRDTQSFTPTRVGASIWNITATYDIYFHYSRSHTDWCCSLLTNELSNKWMFSSMTINSHSLRCLRRVSFNTSDVCLFIEMKFFISHIQACVRARCVSSFLCFIGFIFFISFFAQSIRFVWRFYLTFIQNRIPLSALLCRLFVLLHRELRNLHWKKADVF